MPLNPAHATRLSGCRRFLADDGWLRKVVLGYYQYHAVPGNTTQLRIFKLRVCRPWQSVLVRRGQRTKMCWERFTPVLNRWIPPPRVLHPIPMHASTPPILRKSRMRRRARTDLGGGGIRDGRPYRDSNSPGWETCFSLKCQSKGRSLSLRLGRELRTCSSRLSPVCAFPRKETNSSRLMTPEAGWSIRLPQNTYEIGCGGAQPADCTHHPV